jgi:hypothetical protein
VIFTCSFRIFFSLRSGLKQTLQSRNLSIYPHVCTEVTAAFAVLSDTLNRIRSILMTNNQHADLVRLLQQIQDLEKAKLQWTAALHLEHIRCQQQAHDERLVTLLQHGIQDLQNKLAWNVQEINECMEELHFYIAEEMED